ncbi:MAG: ABC transporter ATP-binding protein, partial [Jatrophihabitantaceae bacterium]
VAASGPLSQLLANGGLLVRAVDQAALERMLDAERLAFRRTDDGAVVVDTSRGAVSAEQLARAAIRYQVLVTELRPADDGLEQLFFSLTGADSVVAA